MEDLSRNDLRYHILRPKHGKKSCGDCMGNKQNFRTLKKLMYRPLDRMEITDRESARR